VAGTITICNPGNMEVIHDREPPHEGKVMEFADRYRTSRMITALVLMIGMASCRSPEPKDVTGSWVVSAESRERFLSGSQRDLVGTIILSEDGTFAATEVPDGLVEGPGPVTGSGVWKLIDHNGVEVQLEFRNIKDSKAVEVPYGTQLRISKTMSGPASGLYYFQGDADQGRRIDFDRQ